jgi:hypothetical protein
MTVMGDKIKRIVNSEGYVTKVADPLTCRVKPLDFIDR